VIIPNAINAVIDQRKLVEYCLCPDHPRGKHKAKVFHYTLGLKQSDANLLTDRIRKAILTQECSLGTTDDYGRRYTVDFIWPKDNKNISIRTSWIIKVSEDFPRLTSCYVL